MSIREEEIMRRNRELFGEPLDAERRASLAATLETLARANLQIVEVLKGDSEPMGHAAVLRSARHGG